MERVKTPELDTTSIRNSLRPNSHSLRVRSILHSRIFVSLSPLVLGSNLDRTALLLATFSVFTLSRISAPLMLSKESAIVRVEPALVPLSTVFCADDADLVIRAAGSRDFRVHKSFLSFASPIFEMVFSVLQPPTDTPNTLSHVDVDESAETWEKILRTVYPGIPNPHIDNLDDLESLLLTAKKYRIQCVIDSHIKSFKNPAFISRDPLHLYAIECTCGFED